MALVENIKSLCDMKGTSVPKLEKELGFSKGSIYNWDKNSPSIDKVQKVANYFRVSLDRVIFGFNLTEFWALLDIARGTEISKSFLKIRTLTLLNFLKILNAQVKI